MNTFVIVMLIVLFGAALMGKMLMDLYPGPITQWFKKKDISKTQNAD